MKKIAIGVFLVVVLVGWLRVETALAQAEKPVVKEALARCENFKRRMKYDYYIPQALLSEKENCLIREYATVLFEHKQEDVDFLVQEAVETCVRGALSSERTVLMEKFTPCIEERARAIVEEISLPCDYLSGVIKIGGGRQGCEETIVKLVGEKFRALLNPPPPPLVKMYLQVRDFLSPVLPGVFYSSLLMIFLYFGDVFWKERYELLQMAMVVFFCGTMLALYLLADFYLGPLMNVLLLGIMIFWNHRPRKEFKDLGPSVDTILEFYDQFKQSDKKSDAEDTPQ